MVNIGKRLLKIRKAKGLTQGDIMKVSGLKRCYISRVENGFTEPSLRTLERFAESFQMPLHDLVYKITYSDYAASKADANTEANNATERAEGVAEQTPSDTPLDTPSNGDESIETDKLLSNRLTC